MMTGPESIWVFIVMCCLAFPIFWNYYWLRRIEKEQRPQSEECPRCGREVEFIDLHLRHCRGQLARRNPLSGALSTIHKSFEPGKNVDVIGPQKPEDLEEL